MRAPSNWLKLEPSPGLPAVVTPPTETIVPPGGKDAQSRHEAWGEVEFNRAGAKMIKKPGSLSRFSARATSISI